MNVTLATYFTLLTHIMSCVDAIAVEKPNVLLILVDDMGWSDLSCYGNPIIETPNIDQLAKEGMRFTDAYAEPVCAPTRAAIQTGQYPARLQLTGVPNGHRRPFGKLVPPEIYWRLNKEHITIAEAIEKSGYVSGIFGKWHLGYDDEHQPDDQGYVYPEDLAIEGPYGEKVNQWIKENHYKGIGNQFKQCVQFIEQYKNQPFFCIASYAMVHTKPEARKELVDKYKEIVAEHQTITDPKYAAMCETVDETVGMFQEVLKSLGILNNTLIIFYSDNGGVVEERGFLFHGYDKLITHNWPLRDEKGTLYEGGIRVPLIVKWPGQVEAGSVNHHLVHAIDWLPTLLELSDTIKPENAVIDGVSILPLLKNKTESVERDIFWHYPHYHHSSPASAIRSGNYKLIYFYETDNIELYDLEKDIGEQYDLAEMIPSKAEALYTKLKEWLHKEVNASLPKQNPYYDPNRELIWGIRVSPERLKTGEHFGLE